MFISLGCFEINLCQYLHQPIFICSLPECHRNSPPFSHVSLMTAYMTFFLKKQSLICVKINIWRPTWAELCLYAGARLRHGRPVTTAHARSLEEHRAGPGVRKCCNTHAFWCETLKKNESEYFLIKERKEERHPRANVL